MGEAPVSRKHIEPGLLMQICRLELPKKYRTKHPEEVSATAVHRWVMGKQKLPIDLEDGDGVAKMKSLSCKIDADAGIRNVQQLFINVFETMAEYQMETSEQEIIKWLCYNISPTKVKQTVTNALRVRGKIGRARRKNLTTFHRLLKKLAQQFYEAKAMGLETGTKSSHTSKPPKRVVTKGGDKKPNKEKPKKRYEKKADKGTFECYHCKGEHKVLECPTCPAEKKKWSLRQWWKHNAEKRSEGAKAAGTEKKPGGGTGHKKALKKPLPARNGLCEVRSTKQVVPPKKTATAYADGSSSCQTGRVFLDRLAHHWWLKNQPKC